MATNKKIFRFTKRKDVNIAPLLENGANVIDVDDSRFTLNDFKLQECDGDKLAYSATICYKDKPVCRCVNNGGNIELTEFDMRSKAILASIQVRLKEVNYSYEGMVFPLTLGKIADFIAETLKNEQESRNVRKCTLTKLNKC